ncbi:MAG: hypothetical protein HFJ65_08125 [Eggerthellaceae bacterium]|nr:hypothetical protein [Eggerthellaceae bacterium]
MADRTVENPGTDVPQMPEILERVLLYAIDEGKQKMEAGEDITPFTTLVVHESVFIETHPGNDAQECFNLAQHTVEGARGASAYAFCYDGYVETSEGVKDAIIAEGGIPGQESGYAIGLLYTIGSDGKPEFNENPSYIGKAPNFMDSLRDATEYPDADIDPKYMDSSEE